MDLWRCFRRSIFREALFRAGEWCHYWLPSCSLCTCMYVVGSFCLWCWGLEDHNLCPHWSEVDFSLFAIPVTSGPDLMSTWYDPIPPYSSPWKKNNMLSSIHVCHLSLKTKKQKAVSRKRGEASTFCVNFYFRDSSKEKRIILMHLNWCRHLIALHLRHFFFDLSSPLSPNWKLVLPSLRQLQLFYHLVSSSDSQQNVIAALIFLTLLLLL